MHISLDAALQRPPLPGTVGDKLLTAFPGAAAAYSLRALNGNANDVVRVRRDGDNDERNFTADGLSLRVTDFVNGTEETSLPGDLVTPFAAYSLRKVRTLYTGDAVQIRRASDNIEVNVAFDSNNEVSTSSAITNVTESPDAGDTSATTLGEFLSGNDGFVVTWYDQSGNGNHATQGTASGQPKIAASGSLLTNGISFDGDLSLQKITTDTTTAASIFGVFTKGTSSASGSRPMGYQEAATTGTNSLAFAMDNTLRFDGASTSAGSQTIPTSGLFLATTIKVSNTEANNFVNGASNIANSSLTLNDTDVRPTLGHSNTTPTFTYDGNIKEAIFYNSDQSANRFKIESNINNHYGLYTAAQNGFVNTWYDQSGNEKNAVAAADAQEPKIVSAGVLLTDGIEFDGTNDNLNTSSGVTFTSSDDLSLFSVINQDSTSGKNPVMSQDDGTGTGRSQLEGEDGDITSFIGGSIQTFGTIGTTESIVTVIYDDSANTLDAFKDGSQSGSQKTSITAEAANGALNIGKNKAGVQFFDGHINEIILYLSDQSDNRTAIESNIAAEYGITLS